MGFWREQSDRVLARLFVRGAPAPSAAAIRDAYPFGPRDHWPYKVWLARVKAWTAAHAMGLASPAGRQPSARAVRAHRDDGATLDLFDDAGTGGVA